MITSIAFTVYPVSDMARARACYEHVLGLHVSDNCCNLRESGGLSPQRGY